MSKRHPRIGLALGSGSARGWSHIGVIRVLERAGISPDIVCGTSIGALVGAVYAAGELDRLEPWVKSLTWKSVLGMMDFRMGGGLIEGARLVDFFRSRYQDPGMAALRKSYACVATELYTGREVWLREGSVIDAVRASIALPGLFTPTQHDGRLLVDGGLVNPVPVSLCRAMGADIVIAVDLNWDIMLHHTRVASQAREPEPPSSYNVLLEAIMSKFRPLARANGDGGGEPRPEVEIPSMMDVLTSSLNIMQMRITQSRMAGEPADVVIRPRLNDVAAMDFHLATPTIAEGERAAEFALPLLRDVLGL